MILPLHAHKTKPGGIQIKAPGWPVTEETGLIAFVTYCVSVVIIITVDVEETLLNMALSFLLVIDGRL